MGFRDEFWGTGKTYAEWSLERVAESGLRRNEELLKSLKAEVRSTYQRGVDRIVRSQESSTAALQDELAYQTQQLQREIQQGSAEVVEAIQQMTDYLGAGLSEIRWAMELQTRVSQQMLHVLLTSLDNQSRQYWEQGVKCYDAGENAIAKERFDRALDANRTNYFAYQYLGFIAVADDNAEEAVRNFELARKFAQSEHQRGLALSQLARSRRAKGELDRAADLSKAATEADPQTAAFWYEHAQYCALLGRPHQATDALRQAIERDWNYWGVAATDGDLDLVRIDVNRLFDELRERERKRAENSTDQVRQAIEDSSARGVPEYYLTSSNDLLKNLQTGYGRKNVHTYRELTARAQKVYKQTYLAAEKSASERRERATLLRADIGEELRRVADRTFGGYGFLCAAGALVAIVFVISSVFRWSPTRVGPTRVFSVGPDIQIRATGEKVPGGTSWQVVSETPDSMTVRFKFGDRTLPKGGNLAKFGRLETGFAEDYTNTLSAGAISFWIFLVPIAVWVLASQAIKAYWRSAQQYTLNRRLNDIQNTINELNDVKNWAAGRAAAAGAA
jgi:tetratricopeptide (TPR) repeat protein